MLASPLEARTERKSALPEKQVPRANHRAHAESRVFGWQRNTGNESAIFAELEDLQGSDAAAALQER